MIKHYLTGQKTEAALITKRRKWETNSNRAGRHIILSKHRGGYCREAQVQGASETCLPKGAKCYRIHSARCSIWTTLLKASPFDQE